MKESYSRVQMPNRPRPNDALSDWLLGGHRKRLVIEALANAPDAGVRAQAVAADGSVGRATAFETFRALRSAGAIEQKGAGAYRLDENDDLGEALLKVVRALRRRGDVVVDRPPSRRP